MNTTMLLILIPTVLGIAATTALVRYLRITLSEDDIRIETQPQAIADNIRYLGRSDR